MKTTKEEALERAEDLQKFLGEFVRGGDVRYAGLYEHARYLLAYINNEEYEVSDEARKIIREFAIINHIIDGAMGR